MTTDLFYGNTFVLFLIFVISVFTVDKLSERQKIAMTYLCSYGIAFGGTIPEEILLPMMTLVLFLVQEFFTSDRKKVKILYKIYYKFADFLYMGVFQYKIWLVYTAICVRTSYVKKLWGWNEGLLDVVSVCLFACAFIWLFDLTEEFHSFTEMYDVVWKTPYYNVEFNEKLRDRLEIITYFEDSLYWKRKKTYSSCSFEFIRVWIENRRCNRSGKERQHLSLKNRIKQFIKLPGRIWYKTKELVKWLKRIITRGHSTIPMQLIRILGYKHGLIFGSTKIRFKYYKIVKRKIYEVIYSRMFFEGLRNYLMIELCNNLNYYREYLVYLYPQIVQTKIDGKVYAPARKAFADKENGKNVPKMNEWDMDKVIRMGFGFNGLSITEKRMEEKRELLNKFDFKD